MMSNALFLALRSLWWFRGRAATIVLCLALTIWLPLTVRILINQFRDDLVARADATPLVIGARGSRIDLALHSLYFESPPPDHTTMGESQYVQDTGFAAAIPLHVRYRTQNLNGVPGVPIVGTAIEYFEFRGLSLASGTPLTTLGDCVLGASVAEQMQLKPGDTILSAPKNAFNLAGDYPLKMNIKGVLTRSHSPDDGVVFVDVKTAWIIDGIGHGHQQLNTQTDDSILLEKTESSVTASAAVLPFTEITPDNIGSFHFHGNWSDFPVSAVIALPVDRKAQTLLLGRYVTDRKQAAQCLKPASVVNDLLAIVFRIERLAWLGAMLSATVTVILLTLVLSLTVRLRAREIQTMHKLGCSRGTVAMILGTEIGLLLSGGTCIAAMSAVGTSWMAADWLKQLLF